VFVNDYDLFRYEMSAYYYKYDLEEHTDLPRLDMVVASSTGGAKVFGNVLWRHQTAMQARLPISEAANAVAAADFDCDGYAEVAIGSFSGEIFLFKERKPSQGNLPTI